MWVGLSSDSLHPEDGGATLDTQGRAHFVRVTGWIYLVETLQAAPEPRETVVDGLVLVLQRVHPLL
jgi:hypothetical protein